MNPYLQEHLLFPVAELLSSPEIQPELNLASEHLLSPVSSGAVQDNLKTSTSGLLSERTNNWLTKFTNKISKTVVEPEEEMGTQPDQTVIEV